MRGNASITKAISFAVVLIGIAMFYYYVIFLPKQEQAKLDFQKQQGQEQIDLQKKQQQAADEKAQQNSTMLQSCLEEAKTNYNTIWEKTCKAIGSKSGCGLPRDSYERIDKSLNDAKDFCFKQYPQK